MKGDENRYLVLGKADVVYDLPKNLQKPMKICTKEDVVFDSPKISLNVEESARFSLKVGILDPKFDTKAQAQCFC
jgi:hypothetical protein